jgi:hypothetical protein
MRTVIVKMHAAELAAEMAAMRRWLDENRFEPWKFTVKRYEEIVSIGIEFKQYTEAKMFEARFNTGKVQPEQGALPLLQDEFQWSLCFYDSGYGATRETMAQACRWRLVAGEIRTKADELNVASARETMRVVAQIWDRMAEDLEQRLAQNPHAATA